MALDDVVKKLKDVTVLRKLASALESGQGIPVSAMRDFSEYIARTEPDRDSAVLARYVRALRQNPEALHDVAMTYLQQDNEKFNKGMGKEYGEMIGALKEPTLKQFALTLPEKNKAYLEIQAKLGDPKNVNERDITGALELCAKQFKEKGNQKLILSLYEYPELAAQFLMEYIQFQAERFENNNLSTKEVKDGKTSYKFNKKKAVEYATKVVGSSKGDEKEQNYFKLAASYAQQKAA
jgi:hypothetical protein